MNTLLVLAALAASGAAPETITLAGITATRTPTPHDAAIVAAADSTMRPIGAAGFYIFLPRSSREIIAAHTAALNCSISHASTQLAPEVLYGGHLLYVDLRKWCPEHDDLVRVVSVLNGYLDRYVYVEAQVLRNVPAYKASDGKIYTTALKPGIAFAPHIDAAAATTLREKNGYNTPLVYGPEWLGFSLRTLEGGLYYKLRGYDKLNQKEWLALFGADEAASDALDSDAFSGMTRSNVTGKPRRAVAFFGIAANPVNGYPLVTLTQDIADGDIDPDKHPIYSLLNFKFKATELIATLPNGSPSAFLANERGDRQDVVPPDIAKDHTIPGPHTGQLEPILSCGRCHGPDDFFKPMPNHVLRLTQLTRGGKPLDIFGDLTQVDQVKATDELRGKYRGQFEDTFVLARNAYERACFKATGVGVAVAWAAISLEWEQHWYDPVTAHQAAFELGWIVPEEANAAAFLDELIPVLPLNEYGVSPENWVIAALCDRDDDPTARLPITRRDWGRIYRDAFLRARDAHLQPKGKP